MLPVAIVGHVPITAGIVGSPEPATGVPLLLPLPLLLLEPPSFLFDPELDPELEPELEPPLELEGDPPPLELDPVLDPGDPLELPPGEPSPSVVMPLEASSDGPSEPAGGVAPLAQLAAVAAEAETSAKADQRAIPIVLALQTRPCLLQSQNPGSSRDVRRGQFLLIWGLISGEISKLSHGTAAIAQDWIVPVPSTGASVRHARP